MRCFLLGATLFLAGCAAGSTGPVASPPVRPYAMLLFGDHGYDLDYLEADERNPPLTLEQAIAAERVEWVDDKRPPAEFAPSAMIKLPDTGGYVAASGMMPVSKAMRSYCQTAQCDSAVMLGDNIYPNGPTGGADGVSDAKRFGEILLEPFKEFGSIAPDFRIYATLGNHDWRTSRAAALAEVHYLERTKPFYMDGIFYRVSPPGRPDVELFVLDTEVLLAGETVYEAELADDGSELPGRTLEEPEPWTKPQDDRERNMVAWLEQSLRQSTARWKIVMAHHPIWSSAGSKFQQARVLRRLILPTLCKYADMYLAGHEHTLELHTDSCAAAVPGMKLPPLPQIVSGAAAKQRPVNSWFMAHQSRNNPELKTDYARGLIWGYVHLTLDGEKATARVFTTPNDGSGTNVLEATGRYTRRTGSLPR
jgi:tartrate-resistant acid phosphatase type 5